MKTKPITPRELDSTLGSDIPEVVVRAVNNLLKKKYRRGQSVTLKQDDILKEICRLDKELSRNEIFNNGWMDFEPLFEKSGWNVEYDKPGYCETYPSTFTFTAK